MFWSGYEGPLRVLLMGCLSYVFLIVLLRATGKRTLSKMNAFDFVITVASGSTFAAVLLDKNVVFAEGAAAFTVLALLQYAVAWSSSRSAAVESVVKSRATVLVWRGEMLGDVMTRERVTESEIFAACRQAGVLSLDEVEAVVLEPAGQFSVLRAREGERPPSRSTLRTATNVP